MEELRKRVVVNFFSGDYCGDEAESLWRGVACFADRGALAWEDEERTNSGEATRRARGCDCCWCWWWFCVLEETGKRGRQGQDQDHDANVCATLLCFAVGPATHKTTKLVRDRTLPTNCCRRRLLLCSLFRHHVSRAIQFTLFTQSMCSL